MEPILKLVATIGAALFAGGALYISVVEHPARLRIGPAAAIAEFRAMYPRAAPWQASAAALTLLAGLAAAWLARDVMWALGALAVGSVIPFTLTVMRPTNHRLLGPTPPRDAEALALLERWGRLHWVRSVLSSLGLVVLLARAMLS